MGRRIRAPSTAGCVAYSRYPHALKSSVGVTIGLAGGEGQTALGNATCPAMARSDSPFFQWTLCGGRVRPTTQNIAPSHGESFTEINDPRGEATSVSAIGESLLSAPSRQIPLKSDVHLNVFEKPKTFSEVQADHQKRAVIRSGEYLP
jgi:hypothetical protein